MSGILGFDPAEMTSGGIMSDVNAVVKEAGVAFYDYNQGAPNTCCAYMVLVDDDGNEATQYWSIGKPEQFQPSADGKSVVPLNSTVKFNKKSNFGILVEALLEKGFPLSKMQTGDMTVLVGLYAFWQSKPRPVLKGSPPDGKDFNVLVPVKILRLPGEKGGKTPATVTTVSADGAEEAATDFILEVLAEKGGKTTRRFLTTAVFSKRAKHPQKSGIQKLLASEDFLTSLAERNVAVDGDSVFLVE